MGRLGHKGASAPLRRELFPNGFGGEVMQLILKTWTTFAKRAGLRLEERITGLFHGALVEAYDAAGRNWFVTLEDPVLDPDTGAQIGFNDLRFYPLLDRLRQSLFFVVECKRLHATYFPNNYVVQRAAAAGKSPPKPKFEHHADDYVEAGMQKFVDNLYSRGMPCGAMLAYVLDNRVADAFESVCKEIKSRRTKLRMKGKLAMTIPSNVLPAWEHSADTVHDRDDGLFVLFHLLVGVG